MTEDIKRLQDLTAAVAGQYFSHNTTGPHDIRRVMTDIFTTLKDFQTETKSEQAKDDKPEILVPAVPIKKSVTPDFIICLEDGKELKMMKRHLATAYGMTPSQYRVRWGLPNDYPMTAPNYTKKRSELAKNSNLGKPKVAKAA